MKYYSDFFKRGHVRFAMVTMLFVLALPAVRYFGMNGFDDILNTTAIVCGSLFLLGLWFPAIWNKMDRWFGG